MATSASRAKVAERRAVTPNAARPRPVTVKVRTVIRPGRNPGTRPVMVTFGGTSTTGKPPSMAGRPPTLADMPPVVMTPIVGQSMTSGGTVLGQPTQAVFKGSRMAGVGVGAVPTIETRGGTVGGGFSNAMSGDVFGRMGLSLPRVLELIAIALAAWLGFRYLNRKAGGKRRGK